MTLRTAVFGLLIFVVGCDAKKDQKRTDNTEDEDDGDAKEKKRKKKKKDGEDSAKTAAASAPPTAATSVAPKPPIAEPPKAAAESPLATLFTGEPDPAIKFLKQKQIPNKPIWVQVTPYWKVNTDEVPNQEPWTDLVLEGKDRHATIRLWLRKPGDAGWDQELSNNCAWSGSSSCKFELAVDGTLGQGIKVKIAQGTAEKNKKPSKVWWMRGDTKTGEELAVFASLRSDVWPKLEGEQLAMLKSTKIAGPGVK